jgi:hypothetical protein
MPVVPSIRQTTEGSPQTTLYSCGLQAEAHFHSEVLASTETKIVCVKNLEARLAKATEEIENLRVEITRLLLEAREYRGRWLSDARDLEVLSNYQVPEGIFMSGIIPNSPAPDDACSLSFR